MGTSPNRVRWCLVVEAYSLLLVAGLLASSLGLPSALGISRGLLETSLHIPCKLVSPLPALGFGTGAAAILVWLLVPQAQKIYYGLMSELCDWAFRQRNPIPRGPTPSALFGKELPERGGL